MLCNLRTDGEGRHLQTLLKASPKWAKFKNISVVQTIENYFIFAYNIN